MTPAARIAGAIEVLDSIATGLAAEPALTRWGRSHRFAGSGDRAAIRDHVFDVLRRRRSCAWLGGGETGRQLMIGWARATGAPVEELFNGVGHGPEPLSDAELVVPDINDAPKPVLLDCPDWLWPIFQADLGADADPVLQTMQTRAPVSLRVNLARTTREDVQAVLAKDGIVTRLIELSDSALEITENPRRLRQNAAYQDGSVELQDAASQAVVDLFPLQPAHKVLDFCAGGGGKSLAMAARGVTDISAHDADPARMGDIPARAARAGVDIKILELAEIAGKKFDLVLCDMPCSGSGAWRRSPEAKMNLTAERLSELCEGQINILSQAAEFVDVSGNLAYVTCSVFDCENTQIISKFLDQSDGFQLVWSKQFKPNAEGDGFFVALLTRVSKK